MPLNMFTSGRQVVMYSQWVAITFLAIIIVPSVISQASYYQFPNGQLTPTNGVNNCGTCPAGTIREAAVGPYCGKCVAPTQTCANGNYMNGNGQCSTCPCPGTSGPRRFGTSCRVDSDGQVTCDCPDEYTGRDCSQCAPGTVQSNQYPYDCVRPNNTNSFSITCPVDTRCPLQQQQITRIVNQQVPSCPAIQLQCASVQQPCSQQQSPCGAGNSGCGSGNGCGGGIPPPPVNQCPCPNSCECPQNGGCPGSCPPPTNQNTTPQPSPCGSGGCGGGVQPTIPPWTTPPPLGCPGPIQCPVNPTPPPKCGENNNNNGCAGPSPCSTCSQGPNCGQNNCPPERECPSPCASPCPDPCNCPSPCPQCPQPVRCPDCNCPQCEACGIEGGPIVGPVIEPCVCDPRGTTAVVGSQCVCKVNVQGAQCNQCRKGYFGLSSTRPEGCLSCFCSGVTDSCVKAHFYASSITSSRNADCTIQLTNEAHSVVYSHGSSGYSYDGSQATLSKSINQRLFWSLPACFKGDRVTSYGGHLSFSRMCSGSGSSLGADHEVILSSSSATIFWTTFMPGRCDGTWNHVEVLLAEPAYWSSWKGEQYRRATRSDIMEVLANLQLILIRATFSSSVSTTSIRNVSLSTASTRRTSLGLRQHIESCRCPTGYTGLSCQNCAPGYYRDNTDTSKSIFGGCKPCPCGKTADGCQLSGGGEVVCSCNPGFSGSTCQDKDEITITCDPFRIREVENTNVTFTCSFVTNSKKKLLMRLGREGTQENAVETNSLSKVIKLDANLRRVSCEVIDNAGVTWAVVYCAVEVVKQETAITQLPPRIVAVFPSATFICVNETEPVSMSCEIHSFGQKSIGKDMEWRKEGSQRVINTGPEFTIHNTAVQDAGTYICSVSDGEVIGAGEVALMVKRSGFLMRTQYPVNITNSDEKRAYSQHSGDYPNYPYQSDQQIELALKNDAPSTGNSNKKADDMGKTQDVGDGKHNQNKIVGFPKAIVDPTKITAKIGDTVVLRCNATGQEPLKFYWKSGSSDYIPVHVRVSHGALIFRSLQSTDAGVYYCVVWNTLGQDSAKATLLIDKLQSTAEVVVAKNSTDIPVEVLHPEITAKIGDNVNFQCRSNISSNVTYVWKKLGATTLPNTTEVRDNGVLTLYRVTEKEAGAYDCIVATKDGGKGVARAILKIAQRESLMVHPRVTITPKSPLRVRTGSYVKIECEGSGTPTPNVTWIRSVDGIDRKLTSSSNAKVIYEIRSMSNAEVGKYSCQAQNEVGKQSESMSLGIDNGLISCKDNEFRCKSGDQCISREDRCDKEIDCKDGSDELNCSYENRKRS